MATSTLGFVHPPLPPLLISQLYFAADLGWAWLGELSPEEQQAYPLSGGTALALYDRPQQCDTQCLSSMLDMEEFSNTARVVREFPVASFNAQTALDEKSSGERPLRGQWIRQQFQEIDVLLAGVQSARTVVEDRRRVSSVVLRGCQGQLGL